MNRPELTEERFIPNPLIEVRSPKGYTFGYQKSEVRSISPSASPAPPASSAPYSLLPTPYSLLYKTGDLARYLPDGNIEFIGRIDNQVKIRGFRIELGEIETALAQHPDILQNTVIVREDNPGDKQLVAYIVPNQDISSNNLRSYLQEKLPSYMIPTAFVQLEQMPLTANGKINRKALPAPDYSVTETDYILPTTPTQQQLAQIWSQILKLDHIGIHNNFFELGGHSLLATQIISRIRQKLAIELPIRTIFESPTINQLASRIERENNITDTSTIQPIAREGNLPLSYAQQRLWFLAQLEPDSYVYNIPLAYHLTGKLNFAALEQSLRAIIARHESLRTNFLVKDGQPTQIIHEGIIWQITTTNLEHLSPEETEAQVEKITTQQAQQPFNLTQDCLFRAQLLILDKEEHILLLTMHHIISDGWSMNLLWSELIALYQAFNNNQTSPLSALPIQYLDFAVWQRQWLEEKIIPSELNYWKQQLAGHLPLLELPLDYPRPPVQTHKGAYQKITISQQLSQSLEGLAQKEGVTLFMLLLAAYQTLLHRYTGQSDIIVGSPIAGRNRAETEGLIGFFVNMLPLRTQVEAEQNFPELLQQVKETVLAAYDHQNLPFEKLVEELQPERNLSHSPIFQVSFNLVNTPSTELELPGIKTTPIEVKTHTAKLDLALALSQTSEGLEGVVEYNTDLFKAETINRLIGHFLTLLEAITVDTEENIARLPILTAAEEHQLLVEWNDTKAEYPNLCIHQLFERQVEKTPEAVAVRFEEQELTYAQLNQKANQLAHYLQSLGVKPGSLVGICVARSIEMIIALLGILKAGGAYVPIDPTYPSDRIDYMLDDSQVSLLVTTESLILKLPETTAKIVTFNTPEITSASKINLIAEVQPDNLAYIIYTSGSTGKPKGVAIAHQGLCNLATAQTKLFDVNSDSRILQFASFSFDAAIWEIVMALGSGAMLCMATKESLLPGINLLNLLKQQRITHLTIPPTALGALPQKELPDLEVIIVAGEACPPELAQQWSKKHRFFNAYGPSESTVCATVAECKGIQDSLPIGHPINNTEIYILDKNLQPVPVGVPGELHISSVGLAQGYWHRPELTQQKFILIPPLNKGGRGYRLYKTGDLAKYLPALKDTAAPSGRAKLAHNGKIEFIGRIDNQVKIRGFRIELGEIESALVQHPHIEQSVVIAREDTPGDKKLVAYLVSNQTITIEQIRNFLQATLPNYMIPMAFVTLEQMPLTPNGKIDRASLPKPESDRSNLKNAYVRPQTEIETKIAAIWQEALKIDKVGIYDNFFDLGGHSLLLAEVQSKLTEIFANKISMLDLFMYPTINAFAGYLANHLTEKTATIQPDSNRAKQRSLRQNAIAKKRQQRQRRRGTDGA